MKMSVTRCPSCGAPVSGTICDYCKSSLKVVYDRADEKAITGAISALIPSYPSAQPEPKPRPRISSMYGSTYNLMMYASCTVPPDMIVYE